ncbi:MAG: hypothetical protein Q4A75_00890 [Peptostreptococcaceae bacterium]|nr:hypothetical protein [Peptostreptococcaceae bacterium]
MKNSPLAFSKAVMVKDENREDIYYCTISLFQEKLLILNNEYVRKGEALYDIPIDRILTFRHLNKKRKKAGSHKTDLVKHLDDGKFFDQDDRLCKQKIRSRQTAFDIH